jgi:cytochrome P450
MADPAPFSSLPKYPGVRGSAPGLSTSTTPDLPPKPAPRPDRVSLWRYLRLFRRDILSAQPAKLYRAWMAEFRTPFFRSYMCNDPALIDLVLKERPDDFPKSARVAEGLRPLLGQSVFVTNGEQWKRQRRIIDPAFEGGRLRDTFPAMLAAADAAVARMPPGEVEIEEAASHAAADVIFRTLFSIPIEDSAAQAVFHAFRAHQRTQPILNLAAFIPLPRWFPRLHRRATRTTAAHIRALIEGMTAARAQAIAAGTAPDDLATKIMTTADPVTGQRFATEEMVDQVAIFFLAGHETSASALGWALYLLATHPDVQDRVAAEACAFPENPAFSDLSRLKFTRDVFRETLRLYPPVPMMVRETTCPEVFRGRPVAPGAQVVISPWHLHRHERMWVDPDAFDPARWQTEAGRDSSRQAWLPFSAGPRVCTGAGFAMAEGVILLARLVAAFRFASLPGHVPVPEAHLTVRARDGIRLSVSPRNDSEKASE